MKIALRVISYLIGLALMLLLAGFLLPSTYKAQRSVIINAPAEKIYPLIASAKAWKQWNVWSQRDPDMVLSYSINDTGVGAKWKWKSEREGNGGMEFTAIEPNKKLIYSLTMDDMAPSVGELTLSAHGASSARTQVTWSMSGDSGMNPVARWFGYFMDRLVGPDFEAGLANLKRISES